MPKCAFSGKEIPKGQGTLCVRKNGQTFWFLNSKCERNFLKLKRKPVDFKWSALCNKGVQEKKKKSIQNNKVK